MFHTAMPTSAFRTIFFLVALQAMPLNLAAQETPTATRLPSNISVLLQDDLQFLREETVITAMRQEQPISEAPANIHVITAEDIRHSGATDIPTLLRRVPGMEVMQMTGADINVSTRGGNQPQANKLLVMIDHRSIYNDAQGFVLWKALPVTLPEIKQIEVLIGPASVLYGFNAFDGIVHIITKAPREIEGTHAQAAGGEFDTRLVSVIHAGHIQDLGYKISGGWDTAHQWRNRNAEAFQTYRSNAELVYAFHDKARIKLTGGFRKVRNFDGIAVEAVLSEIQNSQGYVMGDLQIGTFQLRSYWMRTTHEPDLSPHPLLGDLFTITGRDGTSQGFLRSSTFNVDTQHSVTLGDCCRFTYGLNIRHNRLSSNLTDGFATENRVGLYIQQELSLPYSWRLIAGVRYDIDTFINPTWSPRVSLIWTPAAGHSLLATYSEGYRPPTIFQTHSSFALSTKFAPPGAPPLRFLGESNTVPEHIRTYELGYQGWGADHRLRMRANLFANVVKNLFDPVSGPTPLTSIFTNRKERAVILGTEVGLEFLAASWLEGFGYYAYRHFDKNFSRTPNIRRAGPKHKWVVGLRGNWENGLSAETAFHYVGGASYAVDGTFNFAPLFGNSVPNARVDSYTLLNIKAGYRLWDDRAEVAISAFNALNDRHKEHPLGDTIGSRVLGWLTLHL